MKTGGLVDRIGAENRWTELGVVVLVNLIPLVGILVWEWSLAAILVLYWLENAVIGAVNVPKMILAGRGGDGDSFGTSDVGTIFFACFFVTHYGFFWVGHGVFVFALFVPSTSVLVAALPTVVLALVGLVVQHSVATYREFYRGGHYRDRTPRRQMSEPYRRVVVLHVTIIGGGFLLQGLGSPIGGLAVLVVCKTAYDVAAWLGDREEHESVWIDAMHD